MTSTAERGADCEVAGPFPATGFPFRLSRSTSLTSLCLSLGGGLLLPLRMTPRSPGSLQTPGGSFNEYLSPNWRLEGGRAGFRRLSL